MKEITTTKGAFLFVEKHDSCVYDLWNGILCVDETLTGIQNVEIISTTKDITEEYRMQIIEEHPYSEEYFEFAMMPLFLLYDRKQYKSKNKRFENGTESDELSLNSLIQANGLAINKNYLILKRTNG